MTHINKKTLLSTALSVLENNPAAAQGLNPAAVAAYIPEMLGLSYLPDEIPATMTADEIDAALLCSAHDWHHYAASGNAAICGTYEILARHHGEKEAAAIIDAAEAAEADTSAGEQALNEQAMYLATAAGLICVAYARLAEDGASEQERAQRALRNVLLSDRGGKTLRVLAVGARTTKGGALYTHYRVLCTCRNGDIFDATFWIHAALGFRQTKSGALSIRGYVSAPAEIKARLKGLNVGPVTVTEII